MARDDTTMGGAPVTGAVGPALAEVGDHFHLIVFQGDSSQFFGLPSAGGVVMGRAESCALRLDDQSVSREHARLVVARGQVTLFDNNSQNGTRVNGEKLIDSRVLISGDEIAIGGVTLVFYSRSRPENRPAEIDFAEFRARLDVEIERAIGYSRPLALAAVSLGARPNDRRKVVALLSGELRRTDLLTWDGEGRLLALLPEATPERAEKIAKEFVSVLGMIAPEARSGWARAESGCSADTLISQARSAVRSAGAGAARSAQERSKTIQIGAQTVVVADPSMIRLYQLIERLARSDLSVLILGETGTGKELAATSLHMWSARKDRPLLTLNCAAIPEQLLESELFGYQKGAFTGASESKPGLLEKADGGSVFLDEIGDLPPAAQAKLLRVLEVRRITRVGGVSETEIDIRVIAATHRNLEEEVKEGRFRRDLYFRLAGGLLWIPPLRDRAQELPMLAQAFLSSGCERTKVPPKTLSDRSMQALRAYAWPGNIRELKNLMEYVAATALDDVVEPHDFADRIGAQAADNTPAEGLRPVDELIREVEKKHILAALAATQWNQTRAAELISMPLRTFQARIKQYAIRDPSKPR